jgi:isopropylmalate/homocitrate/citramalate synthase
LSEREKQQFLNDLDKMNKHAIEAGVPVGEEADHFNFLNAINLMRIKIASN